MVKRFLANEVLSAPGRHAAKEAAYEPFRNELRRHAGQSLEATAKQLARCMCPYCGGLIIPYWVEAVVIVNKPPRRILLFPERHGCPEEARLATKSEDQ